MIHNFEKWRKAKVERFDAYAFEMHYHRVADTSYYFVRDFLQQIIVQWIDCNHAAMLVSLTANQLQIIADFLDQMQFAYIHPRSTSHRFMMVREAATLAYPYTL